MPIRINLLAEAQAAEELRRKDPVKRAACVAGFLVFLVGLWASTLQFKIMTAKGELNTLNTKWREIEKNYNAAVASQRASRETDEKLEALANMTTNRFLWGNMLNALKQTINGVEDVQVTHLRTEQTYHATEGTPARTNATQVVPGKPPGATERIRIIVEAEDGTAGGRVNKFKETILGVPYFKNSLAKTNGVILAEHGPPRMSKSGNGTVVNFALQCSFPEKTR